MADTHSPIAVIIPYYQRERGLLRQCIQSVLAQKGRVDARVLVVDDASPVPAQDEVGDLAAESGGVITIIAQANAGPAAARNTGLDHVSADTPFVAFLDSDDQWTGPFLSDAVAALGRGYDLFFGNTRRGRRARPRFDWHDDPRWRLRGDDHPRFDGERDLHEFGGDFFDFLVHRTDIISATAMAYRFDRFPALRFRTGLFQGEDRLFKLQLGKQLEKAAFSPKMYADEGEGVNVFDKSGWGTEGSLRLASNYIALGKIILDEIPLNHEQRAHIRRQLAGSRHFFAASLLHLLRHRAPVDWRRVRTTFRDDPATAALLLPNLARIAGSRLLGRDAAAH